MKKLTDKQIKFLDHIINHLKFWQTTTHIDSVQYWEANK